MQVFTTDGEFLDQWTDFRCPMGIHIDAQQTVYVSDQVPRLSILNLTANCWPGAAPSSTPTRSTPTPRATSTAPTPPPSASRNSPACGEWGVAGVLCWNR